MRKLSLTVIGLYVMFLSAFSQSSKGFDTTSYTPKPLTLDETNIVTSYYTQEGKHSAIQGGIGNEHVVDLSNGLELKFVGWDMSHNKHTLGVELGLDHHTSASSAYVSKSGASKTGGTRVYPSLNWTIENDKGNSFGIGTYYSTEYNYSSFGVDVHATKKISSNTEINGKFTAFFDEVKLIYPSELIPQTAVVSGGTTTYTSASGRTITSGGGSSGGSPSIPSSGRNSYSLSGSIAQVINKRLEASVTIDLANQNGYLGLPFHRVYFADGTDHVENLPYMRNKLPIGFRLNYFMGDNIVIRSYYRYYTDSWGVVSHTAELEVPVKVNPFFSISPLYRYYTQTAVSYFGAYGTHTSADKYYTSNYSLSALNSQFVGIGIHLAPPKGIFNNEHVSSMEVRMGHYTQSTELYASVISFAFTFK